jgi:hypothetical protein
MACWVVLGLYCCGVMGINMALHAWILFLNSSVNIHHAIQHVY